MARTPRNITFVYVPREDRILAAINAGHREAWSCWLTRRLSLAVLDKTAGYLAGSSNLAQRAPADFRSDAIAFERDAAIARTQSAMSVTPADVLQSTANWAELAERLTIAQHAEGYQLELHGLSGDSAAGLVKRPELQRVLQMLQIEVAKAGWLPVAAAKPPAGSTPAASDPKPLRN
jgi:hypothetical protein